MGRMIEDHITTSPQEDTMKKLVILAVLAGIGFAIFKMMNVETQAR